MHLFNNINNKKEKIAVVGLGYVGHAYCSGIIC